jgi:hypothetical protein
VPPSRTRPAKSCADSPRPPLLLLDAQSFLKLKPFGVIDESHVRFLSPSKDVAMNSGIYTFTLQKEGKEVKVQARYTFGYKKINGDWKIYEHHVRLPPPHPCPTLSLVAQY